MVDKFQNFRVDTLLDIYLTLIYLTPWILFLLEQWDTNFLPLTSLIFMSIICIWFANVCFWIKLRHSTFQWYCVTCLFYTYFSLLLSNIFNTENPQNGVVKKVNMITQGRRQGKSLEGAKLPWGSRGQRPLAGVQGAEPLGGGQGAKPPEADTFLVLKSL